MFSNLTSQLRKRPKFKERQKHTSEWDYKKPAFHTLVSNVRIVSIMITTFLATQSGRQGLESSGNTDLPGRSIRFWRKDSGSFETISRSSDRLTKHSVAETILTFRDDYMETRLLLKSKNHEVYFSVVWLSKWKEPSMYLWERSTILK